MVALEIELVVLVDIPLTVVALVMSEAGGTLIEVGETAVLLATVIDELIKSKDEL